MAADSAGKPIRLVNAGPHLAELQPVVQFLLELVLVQQPERESGLTVHVRQRRDLPDDVLRHAGVLMLTEDFGDQ